MLRRLAQGYAAMLLAWFGARALMGDTIWWLALLNSVALYLFLPAPILLAGALIRRQRAALPTLAIPLALFGWCYGELLLPGPPAPPSGLPLRAMTFNLLGSNTDYAAMAAAISASAPDIVALEELTPRAAKELTLALGDRYPYRTIEPFEEATGIGLISRFPILSAEAFDLPPMDLALHTVLNIEGQRVHVLVVHLTPTLLRGDPAQYPAQATTSYARREGEVTRILGLVGQLEGPALLMCDCNMTDASNTHRRLSGALRDSFREAGWGFGHSLLLLGSPLPFQRVDYIWHSPDIMALHASVGMPGGSDHLPVVADLILPTGATEVSNAD